MKGVDADQVALLREVLSATGWLERTHQFARALRTSTRDPGGLLLLGTPEEEPWHLAAHLDDESRYHAIPQLMPTLVRWEPPPDAPAHLRVGLDRLAEARRGETLFVVAEDESAPVPLLERVDDARRTGAVILTLDGGDRELTGLAHESLTVPRRDALISFDGAQHLVSAAAGTPLGGRYGAGGTARRPSLRDRLAKILDLVSGAVPD
ncbi:MAG: hypothetical protein QOE54_7411 [Streptosporangiaceae bacterium]|nr:hypothetical protein [Streptosporangiaceae bacterium]MDX6435045.1 hypothetical protein [Streptosporangiaceae bacterium]